MRGRTGLRALVLGAVLLAGCGETTDRAIKEHGPAARATLAKLPLIESDLRARPPVSADAVAPLEGEPLKLGEGANASLVYLEDLARPSELGNVYARLGASEKLVECAAFLEHKTYPWNPRVPDRWTQFTLGSSVASDLQACGKVRTVLVVRTTELLTPSSPRLERRADAGAPPSGEAATKADCRASGVTCTFDGGYVRAEVHVFALEPFAHKGAFVIEAESSPAAVLKEKLAKYDVERDLGEALQRSFRAGMAKHLPRASLVGWQ